MDTYEKLQMHARNKRDIAIKKARTEYQKTLRAISGLKRTLGGDLAADKLLKAESNVQKGRTVERLVRELAPDDREFTIAELKELVGAHAPSLTLFDSSFRGVLRRLEDQGFVRKVRRSFNGELRWERAEGRAPETPFAALSLPDAAAAVLAETGPLKVKELAVALQARGCRPDAGAKVLTESLVAALRHSPKRFACGADGRWALLA